MSSTDPLKPCPFLECLPSFLQEPLEPARRAEIRHHLDGCPMCRQELEAIRRVLSDLRAPSHHADSGESQLAERILGEVRRQARPDHGGFGRKALAVAGLVAASFVIVTMAGDNGTHGGAEILAQPWDSESAIRAGVDWLLASQEHDGSWSAARHGGRAPFDIGLTGIAIQALLDGAGEDARIQRALDRAAAWLLRHQEQDGRFGPPGSGSLYNHGPATVAVLRLAAGFPEPLLVDSGERAVRLLIATQDPGGGFGYSEPAQGRTNVVISFWPLRALDLARARGMAEADAALRLGQRWISGLCDADGRIGYAEPGAWPYGPGTPTAMGAGILRLGGGPGGAPSSPVRVHDLLGAWALATIDPGSAHRWLSEPDRRQVTGGPHHGSWPPPIDAWGRDGGRVYSTSLGVLVAAAGR